MAYYVYILESELNGSYYVGQTEDVTERLSRHNDGREKYTKVHRPWRLLGVIEKQSRSEAIVLERKLKNLSRVRLKQFLEKHL
jgi:putative endonuclease